MKEIDATPFRNHHVSQCACGKIFALKTMFGRDYIYDDRTLSLGIMIECPFCHGIIINQITYRYKNQYERVKEAIKKENTTTNFENQSKQDTK